MSNYMRGGYILNILSIAKFAFNEPASSCAGEERKGKHILTLESHLQSHGVCMESTAAIHSVSERDEETW